MAGRTNKRNHQQIVCADVSGNNELHFCLTLMDKLPCSTFSGRCSACNKRPEISTGFSFCIKTHGCVRASSGGVL